MQATEAQIGLTMPGIRRAVIASVIGNGLEWFDFLSYAYSPPPFRVCSFPWATAPHRCC